MVKQLAFDFSIPSVPTLDNFVAGRNAELLHHLRELAAGRSRERFVYLWGAPGSGRTHLVRGALAAMQSAGSSVAYVRCDTATSFPDTLATVHALAIDDVEALGEDAQIALFNLYNTLLEGGQTLLVSGNAPPAGLALRPDLLTRLAWGLVYEVHGLTDAQKSEALAEHAAVRGFALQPDVCRYLLTHVRRDMPALLAMVDALDRYSLEAKRPVTVPLLRELLTTPKDLPSSPALLPRGEGSDSPLSPGEADLRTPLPPGEADLRTPLPPGEG